MTDHVVRLYAAAAALLILFVVWAGIAARPWATHPRAGRDPRLVALAAREQRLRREAVVVRGIVVRRWRRYQVALAARRRAIAAARRSHQQAVAAAQLAAAPSVSPSTPSVQVVTLPPLTITRTS